MQLRAQAEPFEDEADHPQVVRDRVLDAQLAAGHARERHEAADLDVVGRDVVLAAVQALGAVDGEQVRADALDVGAHLHEHAREVLHVRLGGGVADHGRARRQRGGHQRVLGRHHRRLVHEHVARPQPLGRAQHDPAVGLDARAHRAERVEVRVEAAAADHVAAGRRHHGAVEAGQQRAREQERGADQLGELAVDLGVVDVRGAQRRPRSARARRPRRRSPCRISSIASTSRMRGTLRTSDRLVGEDAGGQDRERAVLVPGRHHGAGERRTAFDHELLHELAAPRTGHDGAEAAAFGEGNSHLRCQVRAGRPGTCMVAVGARAGAERLDAGARRLQLPLQSGRPRDRLSRAISRDAAGAYTCSHIFRPSAFLPYEHMFSSLRTSPLPSGRSERWTWPARSSCSRTTYHVDWEVDRNGHSQPVHPHRAPLRTRRPAAPSGLARAGAARVHLPHLLRPVPCARRERRRRAPSTKLGEPRAPRRGGWQAARTETRATADATPALPARMAGGAAAAPLDELAKALAAAGVGVEPGPVTRTGAAIHRFRPTSAIRAGTSWSSRCRRAPARPGPPVACGVSTRGGGAMEQRVSLVTLGRGRSRPSADVLRSARLADGRSAGG